MLNSFIKYIKREWLSISNYSNWSCYIFIDVHTYCLRLRL